MEPQKHAFSMVVPTLCHTLPPPLGNLKAPILSAFWKAIKTWLFTQALRLNCINECGLSIVWNEGN